MTEISSNASSDRAARARLWPLDTLNFFLADIRDGLGPYLAIYLLTVEKWNEGNIGLILSISAIAGIVAQTPAGILVDSTHAKRGLIAGAAVIVTGACLALPYLSSFWPAAVSQALSGAAAAVFAPAVAAISLGTVGRRGFSARIGRNESFNHAGNAFAAIAAGIAGYIWGPIVVFFLLGAMALASLVSVLAIPAAEINDNLARGFDDAEADGGTVPPSRSEKPAGWSVLFACRPLLIFAATAVLFHLANAAMLPLVGQKLALENENLGTSLMSACIVAAQFIMVPMAMLVSFKADSWGRKPIFLAALLILPIRGILYTLSNDPFWLVGVQLLDGVGAGIYGALLPIIVADLMRGTGRFNAAQGLVLTAQGIGAALSTTIAGYVVMEAGFSAAFLTLGGLALLGLLLFLFFMPETKDAALPSQTAPRVAPAAAA